MGRVLFSFICMERSYWFSWMYGELLDQRTHISPFGYVQKQNKKYVCVCES